MKAFLVRQWFLIGLLGVLVVGFTLWEPLVPLAARFPEKAVVAVVLFLMSWSLDSHAMWRAVHRPGAAILGIAINFAVVPLLAWLIAFSLPDALGRGLCLAAALPCTLASAAVWTRRAGGNDAVALVVTMVTNFSCFLVTPLLLWLMTGSQVSIANSGSLPPPWNMVVSLGLVAVLPMLIGQLLRIPPRLARFAAAKKSPLSVVCLLGILTMVLLGAINSGHELAKGGIEASLSIRVWITMIAAAAAVHTGALVFGLAAARGLGIARPEAIAVGFAGSQKTLMVGLHIALGARFGIGVLPLVVYHVLQLMIDTIAADLLKRRGTGAQGKMQPTTGIDEAAAMT